ncbi:hypothetical protein EZS27_043370, partial [termite gut metagenome]
MIYPSLQKIVDEIMEEIITESVDETFELFFLRIKAEELVCRLLMELEKRDEQHLYALNIRDIQTIYKVKEQRLEHPEIPPVIKELAVCANMSPSKLNRLFKQIFGNSIFSYYQAFALLLCKWFVYHEYLKHKDAVHPAFPIPLRVCKPVLLPLSSEKIAQKFHQPIQL